MFSMEVRVQDLKKDKYDFYNHSIISTLIIKLMWVVVVLPWQSGLID